MNKAGLCLILILSLSACAFAVPGDLLLNGSFESGTSGWSSWTEGGGWAALKNSGDAGINAHTGTKYVVAGGNAAGELGGWFQNISVTPGNTFDFTAWARNETWHDAPEAVMLVEFKNAGGTTILTDTHPIFTGTLPSPNVWAQFNMTSSPAPATATSANFVVRGDVGSPVFDDLSAVLLGPNPDSNYDKTVNNLDFANFAQGWQKSLGQNGYDEIHDFDEDGDIDINDLELFATSWLWSEAAITVTITDSTLYQEIDGFGASLTDSSAWALHEFLNTADYNAAMQDLFNPVTGAGINYLRQPMGTSDMRRRPDYSYNDTAGDYDMSEFTIAKDMDYIIPAIQDALAINPNIKVMSSPWSAPSWMKSGEDAPYQGGWLTNNPTTYSAYADYFVKYVQAYEAVGIPIDAITLQNEPGLWISYPSMIMSAADQIQLTNYLGPKFATANIDTKIIAYDHNWNDPDNHALNVLANSTARGYLDGIAWHHYAGDVSKQTTVRNAYPTENVYFTEGAIGTWMHAEGDFDGVLFSAANLIIKTTRNWAKTVVLWNMAMHEIDAGPITPGATSCWSCFGVVTIDSITKEVRKNGSFYALGQACKFVKPGARRIASTDTSATAIKNVSFVNPDGSVVVFAMNQATDSRNFQIDWNSDSLIYPLDSRSVTTFVWPDQAGATVEVWVTTGDKTKLFSKEPNVQF